MISQKLVDAVHIEAAKLKKTATKDELAKLDFETFNPQDPKSCIYGQVANYCRSPRAQALILKCCRKLVDGLDQPTCSVGFTPKTSLNGGKRWSHFSPIEVYIVQGGSDNEQLIRYLKGQRKTLNLNKTVNC